MVSHFLLFIVLFPTFYVQNKIYAKAPYTKKDLAALPPVDWTLQDASKTDVLYYLFKNSSQREGIILYKESINKTVTIDTNLPTKLFIHGYTTSPETSPWYNLLKTEYFAKGPHNIFYINWQKAGSRPFDISAANVKPVGKFIAEFLIATEIPPENIHIIGHSLGTPVSGFIGKYFYEQTGEKIGRITGLDSAGPSFEKHARCDNLCENDAVFVDVIHTDIGYFGGTKPIGHLDVYPNGGRNQPGCPSLDVDDNCSHARSTLFFIESVSRQVNARKGKFNQAMDLVLEDDNGDEIVFGDGVSHQARGIYVSETHSTPPYLKL